MYVRKKRKKWQCLVRLKGVAVSSTFFSKSEASNWGKEKEVEILNGTYLKDLKLTQMRLKDLLQLYLEKAMHKSKRPKILKYDVEMLRRFPIARHTLASLSPVHLADFRDDRLRAGKSRSTVRSYLKLISRAITIGRKELNIPMTHNPVELVEKPKPNAPRDRTLDQHELKKLFNACGSCSRFHFLSTFAEVAYLTLCRRGELLNLKRQDVNFINRTAILQETKADKPRTIALAPRVVELLKALPRTVDGIFFPVRSISAFEKSFKEAVKRAGITDFHLHDLRHCGAQHLIEDKGWNTMELMQQGGWSSASMAKRYANISVKHLAKKLGS